MSLLFIIIDFRELSTLHVNTMVKMIIVGTIRIVPTAVYAMPRLHVFYKSILL